MKLSEDKHKEIIRIIGEYIDGEVTMDSELATDLGLSSFDAVMILDTVNEQLGLSVDVDLLYDCKTVGDLLERIEE